MATESETIYMCSDCGICFAIKATFINHICKGNNNPMIIASTNFNSEDLAMEKRTPEDKRRTMFECKDCNKWFYDTEIFSRHTCINADNQDKPAASASSNSEGMFWTRPATLLLIEEYKNRMDLANSGKLRKKALWMQISNVLQAKGHSMSSSQCEGRWKTLMRGLKSVHDHNNKSDNNPRQYQYENELAFMAEKPNVSESYVVSSGSSKAKPAIASSSCVTALPNSNMIENDSDSDSENTPKCSTKLKKDESPENEPKPKRKRPNEVIDVLKNFMETQQKRYDDEAKRKEQMHKERMGIFVGFLEVLKGASAENKDKH